MDEIAEESISIKIRETCGSSLAVLRVHVVLLNKGLNIFVVGNEVTVQKKKFQFWMLGTSECAKKTFCAHCSRIN